MIIQIKDIADIRTGVYLKPTPAPTANYLQVSDFGTDGEVLHEIKPFVEAQSKNEQHLLQDKDILFAAKGAKNFGVIYENSENVSYAASSFLVIRVVGKSKVLPEYVNWYLNLPSSIAKLQFNAVGSSIQSITKQMIEEFEIEVPPMEKQRVIVELARLQSKEQQLYIQIAAKQKQLIDNKLKTIIKNGN